MENNPISVLILTYNEEIHLKRALDNISDITDEIVIVDSFSTDNTLEIAKEFGAKIHQHKFENQAKQLNWALDNIGFKNEWVLRLDADEWLTEELKEEIIKKIDAIASDVSGFFMPRRVYFMGRWIKHGGYYPTWILRLFKQGKVRCEDREVDEHFTLSEGKAEKLKNDFADENLRSLNWWIEKHNNYASREATAYLKENKMSNDSLGGGQVSQKRKAKDSFYYKLPMFLRALLYWKYRYFIKLGFLDGIPGLIFHFLQGFWYRFLVDAKLYEKKLQNIKTQEHENK